jgi:dTDP-L-rhamnose 4-epimerase
MRNSEFAGEIRAEEQLKRGEWEMLCPRCGEPGEWQWTPETHVAPPNAYAMAKFSQEQQAMTFGERYEIPSVALRYSIVQGPRQSFYNAYSGACRIFCLNYYFGRPPTLYEDGLQCRDFVNIHDVVRANLMALEDGRMDYKVFNVGGKKAYTVNEFAEVVREVSADYADFRRLKGNETELPEARVPGFYRFGDTRNACSDISKIRALGWEPEMTPRDSVREYVAWLYKQDNVEDILAYAEKTMKEMNVVSAVEQKKLMVDG